MKINYVTVAGHTLGSYRYQLLNAAEQLMAMGHSCVFSCDPIPDCDVYIFHKHFRYEEQETIKQVTGKTVFAVCDYHFNTVHRQHYVNMINSADLVVAATKKLAGYIKDETGKDATIIYDTWGVEFEEQPPRFRPNGELVCMWFGHISNIEALQKNIKKLDGCKLMVVTDGKNPKFIPYSIRNMKGAFSQCDLVIIPQDETDPRRLSKTHNRVVDSFRQGKFVIASPVDAYMDFKDWAYIGDMKAGLDWLKEQRPEDIERVIGKAQDFIRKTFDPVVIAKQWEAALIKLNGGENGEVSLSND